MHLPHAESAVATVEKVRDFLLNPRHPANRGKADGLALFGFSMARWQVYQASLLAHARSAQLLNTRRTPYGELHAVEGMLNGADGRTPWVRSVWEVRWGDVIPRLVTAHLTSPPKEHLP